MVHFMLCLPKIVLFILELSKITWGQLDAIDIGPKEFWVIKIKAKTNCGSQKSFDPNNVGSIKILSLKSLAQTKF